MKPGDFKDISVSKLLHFVQSAGLQKGSSMVDVRGTLWCPPCLYSILCYTVPPRTIKDLVVRFWAVVTTVGANVL
jgi:hypothetical protein